MNIRARCEGKERSIYRVSAQFDGAGIIGWNCSCADWGNPCKHVGALLLSWTNHPDSFVKHSTSGDLMQLLKAKPKEELLDVLNGLLSDGKIASKVEKLLGKNTVSDDDNDEDNNPFRGEESGERSDDGQSD